MYYHWVSASEAPLRSMRFLPVFALSGNLGVGSLHTQLPWILTGW